MQQPKVIFFDAVGTLFGVRGSVGEVYSAIARTAGVSVAPDLVEQAFRQSFKAAPPPVFPGIDAQQLPEQEFLWWEQVVLETFTRLKVLDQFSDFEGFFVQLYAHFSTPAPWMVYPEVIPALKAWQARGIQLGIISNFDTRLYALIELLGLGSFFAPENITISSTTGAAKPDTKMFLSALEKSYCLPQQAWHIGDHPEQDYEAARKVGIRAFLIERP